MVEEGSFEFELVVKARGMSMDITCNQLMQAAGEVLKMRMVNPPAGPLGSQVKIKMDAPVAPTVARMEPEVKKQETRGRKPGVKVGPYKNKNEGETKNVEENETIDESGDSSSEESTHASAEESFTTAQEDSPPIESHSKTSTKKSAKAPSLDDAVKALKHVNSNFNIDTARACVAAFNVKRVTDLPEGERQAFIDHCMALKK